MPQPPEAREETPEVLSQYVARIQKNLGILRAQLEGYRPDALIIVGDDQTEVFSKAFIPSMAIYLGEEVSGTTSVGLLGMPLPVWASPTGQASDPRGAYRTFPSCKPSE